MSIWDVFIDLAYLPGPRMSQPDIRMRYYTPNGYCRLIFPVDIYISNGACAIMQDSGMILTLLFMRTNFDIRTCRRIRERVSVGLIIIRNAARIQSALLYTFSAQQRSSTSPTACCTLMATALIVFVQKDVALRTENSTVGAKIQAFIPGNLIVVSR